MNRTMYGKFTVKREHMASSDYVVFSANEVTISHHRYQMLNCVGDGIPYIVPPDYRKKDETVDIYFDVTGKTALSQYLQDHVLKKDDVLKILSGVITALRDCEGYLLPAEGFVLRSEY